jgi:DNA-binding NtrC family response regulator
VGGRENIPIDVRIISATNRDLGAAVTSGLFRSDLLFRLRVVPLHVPDLRQRGDDIKLLALHFLLCHGKRQGAIPRRFSDDAMRALTSYRWPGNVRELENAVEYALAVSEGEMLTVDDLPPEVLRGGDQNDEISSFLSSDMQLAEVERRYILAVYKRNACHQIRTAAALGIDRRTLYRKLQQYSTREGEGVG